MSGSNHPNVKPRRGKGKPGRDRAKPPLPAGVEVRRACVALLNRVLRQGKPLDLLLEDNQAGAAYRGLAERDRALARAILGSAFRHRGSIEAALQSRLDKPLHDPSGVLSAILHTGAAQILFLDIPDHAAVSVAVALAKSDGRTRRAAGLVNSVLRRMARDRETILTADPGNEGSVPQWMIKRWSAHFDDDVAKRITNSHGLPPYLDLTCLGDPKVVAERIGGHVLPNGSVRVMGRGPVEQLDGYQDGQWWVQDSAAAMPARFLGDVAGKRVADLCAAPGGKTAQLTAAGAQVIAVDRSSRRLERLETNLARLKLTAIAVQADIATWEPDEPFDAILLDAPCTATGTIRRHPEIPWIRNPSDIEALATLQEQMLSRAADWLKPGGLLVYSTCSLEPEEGEERARGFLEAHAAFSREKIRVNEVAGRRKFLTGDGDFRSKPCNAWGPEDIQSGMDGFFAARFRIQND